MRGSYRFCDRQSGVALALSLLFLLVVTIISVVAASNSALGLKMSSNMQDSYRSLQEAEAGLYGTLGLVGTAQDPFSAGRPVERNPFEEATDHPLRGLADDDLVDVDVFLIATDRVCPRPPSGRGGTSVGITECDYYRVMSEHEDEGKARTQVEMGVVKTNIGSNR